METNRMGADRKLMPLEELEALRARDRGYYRARKEKSCLSAEDKEKAAARIRARRLVALEKARAKDRAYYAANREKLNARDRARRKGVAKSDKERASARNRYLMDPAKAKEQSRACRDRRNARGAAALAFLEQAGIMI